MIYKEQHINYLETLPLWENRAAYLARKNGSMYRTNIYGRGFHTEISHCRLIRILLKKYLGKPYNDLYSEWSKYARKNDLYAKHKNIIKQFLFDTVHTSFEHYYIDRQGILKYYHGSLKTLNSLKSLSSLISLELNN
jgi:hypothetical protein